MSGFEVAGVVLGSIPIVVSALQFYIKGLGTMGRWRRFTLELESLVLKLVCRSRVPPFPFLALPFLD